MVVLDAAIVNVALPHIQRTLGFTGSGLEWVVTAYAVTFGGLLLLGGRSGDLLGRRRIFIAGLLLFSAASLLGGFATSQAWLLAARAVQGVGGAMVAPTALALIATTFPEGAPRNRALGVYPPMTGGPAPLAPGPPRPPLPHSPRPPRAGPPLIVLALARAVLGLFFLLPICVQHVRGYAPVKSGLAALPFAAMMVVVSGIVSQLVARIGARPLMLGGGTITAGGMY